MSGLKVQTIIIVQKQKPSWNNSIGIKCKLFVFFFMNKLVGFWNNNEKGQNILESNILEIYFVS